MPYFIILPLWLVAVAGMAAATVATRLAQRLRPAYPFAWRILVWTSVGFVTANALVMLFYFVAAQAAAMAGPGPHHPLAKIGLASALLLAPIAGSVGGFLAGLALAVWLAVRATRPQQ